MRFYLRRDTEGLGRVSLSGQYVKYPLNSSNMWSFPNWSPALFFYKQDAGIWSGTKGSFRRQALADVTQAKPSMHTFHDLPTSNPSRIYALNSICYTDAECRDKMLNIMYHVQATALQNLSPNPHTSNPEF